MMGDFYFYIMKQFNAKTYKFYAVAGVILVGAFLIGINYLILFFWNTALNKEAETKNRPVNHIVRNK